MNSSDEKLRRYDDMAKTHDSSLPVWGPYSKRMAGVAHISDKNRGASFNLSVFPVLYRGKSTLPTERVETNWHPWYASGDLNEYTYRFELEWKDRLYCDITYKGESDEGRTVLIKAVNNTDLNQMIGLHYLASMQYPMDGKRFAAWVKPVCNSEFSFIDAVNYDSLIPAMITPQTHLVYDGRYFNEELISGTTHGRCVGKDFAKHKGDHITYTLTVPEACSCSAFIRIRGQGHFALGGDFEGELAENEADFVLKKLTLNRAGTLKLEMTELEGGSGACLDCIVISPEEPVFVDDEPEITPVISENGNKYTLEYSPDKRYYISLSEAAPVFRREILGSDWENVMNENVMNHVSTVLKTDKLAHYTDIYERPIILKPHSSIELIASVSTSEDFVQINQPPEHELTKTGNIYSQSIRIMRAVMLTNIVYPVYVQGEYIRHFTPGKWWDSLYTWDSGFIALGLTTISIDRALETLNCYLTDVGNPHAAFIHHGSPVPVQAYVYKAIWDKTHDRQFLKSFYPRLRQYYEFLMGRTEGSDTMRLGSGLINTFSYFYNSGGWDDYPPQKAAHLKGLTNALCPCVSSAHAIVFARILRHASSILELGDESVYDKDIERLANALNTYAYDRESGYYGYVLHDAAGKPAGIFRNDDGVNFNMGLDGAEPALAGICDTEAEERLISYIMDPAHMWTECGISTVDQSAPYFRTDGYWNGAVWMPHQWFVFLEMLAANKPENAVKIAMTALDVWKRETDSTYNCYEHFVIASGRGAGWHHFSGLSAPVLLWYEAMFKPGTVTAPVEAFITESTVSEDDGTIHVVIDAQGPRDTVTILAAVGDGDYSCRVNRKPATARRLNGVLAVSIPGNRITVIDITR